MSDIKFEIRPVSGKISANFDEVEHNLEERMKQYDGIVFTEETKADAKKLVADLRKEKKEILDNFKMVKEEWMKPLDAFKLLVDGLVEKVDRPIDHINNQVQKFETDRLEERRAEIKKIYDEEIGDMADFIPLYHIQNEKWMNASKTLKSIRKELVDIVSNVRAGKTAIEAMQSDAVPSALKKFQASLNLPDAIAYINAYETQKDDILKREEENLRKEEERKHRDEIERVRAEERERVAEEERIRREAIDGVKKINEEVSEHLRAPQARTVIYTVLANDEEIMNLEMALDSLGIYYERKDV